MRRKKTKHNIYTVKTLGKCPECKSLRLGIIKPDLFDYEKQAKRYYKKYHCFLKFENPSDWNRYLSANRFCLDCGFEWQEEENLLKTNRFRTLTFTKKEDYLSYLKESCYESNADFKIFHHPLPKKKKQFAKTIVALLKRMNIFSDFL